MVVNFSVTKGLAYIYNGAKRAVKALPKKLGLQEDIFTLQAKKGAAAVKKGVSTAKKEVTKMSDDIGKIQKGAEEHIPNYVVSPQEAAGIRAIKIKYYPEDIAKMATMTEDEALEYTKVLKKARRYTLEG